MRKFEKVSKETLQKIFGDNFDMSLYDDLELPKRATKYSAGYDFHMPMEAAIGPKATLMVYTLVKCDMEKDNVLLIDIRSSLGFKYNLRLINTIAVIDKDYYNNPDNEGLIGIKLYNAGDQVVHFKKGDRFAQGIFVKYDITDDDEVEKEREGGFGSTGK